MLPKKDCSDPLQCLQNLVGVRSECDNADCYFFYIEDLEGVELKRMAELSSTSSPSGKGFGRDMIDGAAREMLGDIELLLMDGYSLKESFGDLCMTSQFVETYTNGAGSIVTSNVKSSYGLLRITRIEALTNRTGNAVLIVHDGIVAKMYNVTLTAGAIVPILLDYSTQEKSAKIYFQDETIGVAQMVTTANGGCGCSGNKAAMNTIKYSGFIGNVTLTAQYGLKVCASVSCSNELLICDLVKKMPRIFGMTLLYKTGAKYYSEARLSERNTRTAGMDEEKKIDMADFYTGLYNQRLRGTRGLKGITTVVGAYLKQSGDKCVVCNSTVLTSWATG